MKVIGIRSIDKCVQTRSTFLSKQRNSFPTTWNVLHMLAQRYVCPLRGGAAHRAAVFCVTGGYDGRRRYEETWPLVALREIEKLPRYVV